MSAHRQARPLAPPAQQKRSNCGALQTGRAAEYLDVSPDHFARYVAPELPVVRSGRLKLYRVLDLEAWLADRIEQP